MKLSREVKIEIENNILCWLATSSQENIPNVSPKEIYTYYNDEYIIVANIASPQTVKNIKANEKICISFIDVLKQKGFQVKGIASIINNSDDEFSLLQKPLEEMTGGKFPFSSITKIKVSTIKSIVAPKYVLYPNTTEEEQIESAKKAYNI